MKQSRLKGKTDLRRVPWLPWGANGTSPNGRENGLPLFASADTTVIGERFRVLRTRVQAAGPGTFMISSALGQEGKTLCTMNLALALSMRIDTGVILVDADLRRSSAGVHFGVEEGAGLADCLMGEARWQDCLFTTKYDRLRLLPAGRRTALAPELLASERMQTIVAELKAAHPQHYILFDTPPILLTADPLVLARHMDHVLLVVRAGLTPRTAVSRAIESLGADCFMGIVFNDATDSIADYYHYGSRYYYGDHKGSSS